VNVALAVDVVEVSLAILNRGHSSDRRTVTAVALVVNGDFKIIYIYGGFYAVCANARCGSASLATADQRSHPEQAERLASSHAGQSFRFAATAALSSEPLPKGFRCGLGSLLTQ
jgi:hypothetical protein